MTYLRRICEHYELNAADLQAKTNAVFPNSLSLFAAKNLLKNKPEKVPLSHIKIVAVALNCNYLDLIHGTAEYKGIAVKF